MPAINLNNANGPLASLEFNTKYDTTFFPSDLVDTPYFIIFRAQKEFKLNPIATVKPKFDNAERPAGSFYDPNTGEVNTEENRVLRGGLFNKIINRLGGEDGLNINITQPAHSFALPIPSNLSTSYNAQYNNVDLGVGGSIARNITQRTASGSGSLVSNVLDAIEAGDELSADNLKGILGNAAIGVAGADTATQALIGLLGGGVAGAAAAAIAGNIGTGVLVGLGVARNPHIANVFTGVNFRTHQFNYKLIAKNKKESDSIRDLIRNFKFHMSPDYNGSDHIFTYPSKFQIILKAGDYLFKIGDSVLTEFSVDYNGEGAPYFFEDTNAPYSVSINMTFVENTIVTKREIRQGR